MRRSTRLRCALGMVLAMFGGVVVASPVSADAISDQKQEVKDVVAEIERMHKKVDELNEQYLGYLNQKSQLDADIAVSQQKIADQQAQLGVLQSQLASVAIEKVMGGGSGALGPLFTDPVEIDEGLQRDHLARVAVNAGAASTDDYETLLDELDKETKSLEKKQQQALDLAEQAENSRIQAEEAAVALEERLVKEKAKLGELIEQEEERQAAAAEAAYAQQVKDAQARAQARSGSGSSAATGSSGNTGGGSSNDSGGGGGSSDSGNDSSASVPAVSSRASVAVNAAMSQIGVPYRFASSSPGVAFDCSGLTAYAWGAAGVGLPHQSASQFASIPHIPKDQAQPGDLIFYYSPISHVGIYLGGSTMVHAPRTGQSVSVSKVRWDRVVGVGRPG